MTRTDFNKSYVKPILIITMFAVLTLALIGCEDISKDFGCEATGQDFGCEPTGGGSDFGCESLTTTTTGITTEDKAILAVQEHLMAQAESSEAKLYLADFYTTCDDWSAESETFEDGTSVWHVVIKRTSMTFLTERPYWEQASWFVFKDGKIMGTNRFQANALRIEADLQKLSPSPKP